MTDEKPSIRKEALALAGKLSTLLHAKFLIGKD
jgi:hypothetical protein